MRQTDYLVLALFRVYSPRVSVAVNGMSTMSENDYLLKSISSHCTGSAWEVLRRLRGHRKFPALVRKLSQQPGMVLQGDVEQTFKTLLGTDTQESAK